MAEGDTTTSRTAAQVAALGVLAQQFGEAQLTPLSAAAVRTVCDIPGSLGWKLGLPDDATQSRELWFVLPGSLPLAPPLACVSPTAYRQWPHVESDGKFCLWRDGEAPVGRAAADQMREVLARVSDVIGMIYPVLDEARTRREFDREWTSYWAAASGRGRVSSARLLLLEAPPTTGLVESTLVSVHNDISFLLVGGSRELRASWCKALGTSRANAHEVVTLSAPLSVPPLGAPEDLPALEELLANGAPALCREQLVGLTAGNVSFFVVVHAGKEQPMFAALELAPVRDRRPAAGYQSSRSQRHRLDHRKIVGWRVGTALVERADAAWLRGRGFDTEAQKLADKHVVVVGCGSLGGLVARALTAAGVGRLSLIDPDFLSAANLGRHVLSARHLGELKAKALADELRCQNPCTRVDAFPVDIAHYVIPVDANSPDLIIGTTGNWPAENSLIGAHASGRIKNLQLTWAERHAIVGHTLLATTVEDDISALYNADGDFLMAATDWHGQTYTLPGCAGSHQPGTFNRIQRIAGLAVEQAIRVLVGDATSEHRVWLGESKILEKLGGTWTSAWPTSADTLERTLVRTLPTKTKSS